MWVLENKYSHLINLYLIISIFSKKYENMLVKKMRSDRIKNFLSKSFFPYCVSATNYYGGVLVTYLTF